MIINTRKNQSNRGFIGLLALLISVAIIMILMFGSKKPSKEGGKEKDEDKSIIKTQFEAVDKAKDVKSMLEDKKYDFE